jgi:hypothetical protein
MKVWNFKIKSDSPEIIKKLNSAFKSVDGFVLDVEKDNNNSLTFYVRKRILYGFQTILRNHIIVKGKITHTDSENETYVEISFNQHFLNTLEIYIFLILGLLAIIFGVISNNAAGYIYGSIFLVIEIPSLIFVKRQFARNIQEYKTYFTDILEL